MVNIIEPCNQCKHMKLVKTKCYSYATPNLYQFCTAKEWYCTKKHEQCNDYEFTEHPDPRTYYGNHQNSRFQLYTLDKWAEIYGVPYEALSDMMTTSTNLNAAVKILTKFCDHTEYECKGEKHTIPEWCALTNTDYKTVQRYMYHGHTNIMSALQNTLRGPTLRSYGKYSYDFRHPKVYMSLKGRPILIEELSKEIGLSVREIRDRIRHLTEDEFQRWYDEGYSYGKDPNFNVKLADRKLFPYGLPKGDHISSTVITKKRMMERTQVKKTKNAIENYLYNLSSIADTNDDELLDMAVADMDSLEELQEILTRIKFGECSIYEHNKDDNRETDEPELYEGDSGTDVAPETGLDSRDLGLTGSDDQRADHSA